MSIDDRIDEAIDNILYYPKIFVKSIVDYCFRKNKS